MTQLPPRLPGATSEGAGAGAAMHRVTLRFRDDALEARFRAAYDGRCLRILRLASLAGAILILASGVLIDLFVPFAVRNADVLPLALRGAFALALGIALTYVPTLSRHPQASVVGLCVLYALGSAGGLGRFPQEFISHRGFLVLVLHLFSVYSLLRLRVVPAAMAGTLSVAAYAVMVSAYGLLQPADLARHTFWLNLINVWGILICWQLDASARREFAANAALDHERARAEGLLLNILPAGIVARLKVSQQPIADHREQVTVLFADLVGFTPLSARMEPAALVALLDRVFTGFDQLAREHGLEKIKTIGDAYMAVAGVPEPQADHALRAARMALAMVGVVREVARESGEDLQVRIGLHSGPVVAGVIGRSKFSYDLWGDTVNTASRMESSGLPGRVHCSAGTAAALEGSVAVEPRGRVEVKGKGMMETFLLLARA